MGFVNDFIDYACMITFVFQHSLEHAPARIQNRFSLVGFDEIGTGYVANENGCIIFDEFAAELMQFFLTFVSDSGTDGFDPLFLLSSLGCSQFLFQGAVVSPRDLLAIGDRHRLLAA